MNKAAQKFAQVTALNGVRICHRSIGETSKPAVLMIMKLCATDEAFPDWTPRLQGVVEEAVAIDYARGGVDWNGKGAARQNLAVNAWTASKLAAHKEGLKKLAVPALVMHGRYDPLIPVEAGRALHELIPGARLMEYDGGHNLGNDDTVRGLIEAAIVEHIAIHN